MGSSAKRKKEKKQDFQKPKLKVGKTKPKPTNSTDTTFRSKAIILNQQSLNVSAPTAAHQFQHYVSLLTSRSDTQRKESLAYLTTYVSTKPVNSTLPQPFGTLLEKLCPLILDGSNSVRDQLLRLFQSFQVEEFRDHVVKVIPFVRAGMTHLSPDIQISTTEFLSWLLSAAGEEVVSCPGGWVKTLDSFTTLLGWKAMNNTSKWSSGKAAFSKDAKKTTRVMQVLAQFLQTGFNDSNTGFETMEKSMISSLPLWHTLQHSISGKSNAYSYLDLYGSQQVEENQILEDREDRVSVFDSRFRASVIMGVENAKQEGGEPGRAAGNLVKALKMTESGG